MLGFFMVHCVELAS